ncbi:MAG: cobyric acid synthase [Chloroflexaceae bacterium]|nr:cobyric acid synthase [Chloroflexaceae bacterium]
MVQGTMSSVGKSLLVAALCRICKQDGWRVAPFKAQNMALNSFATHDGREVGRAQAMQAAAAGVEVTVEMNPVLLKPEADSQSQVVVLGRPWERLRARDYYQRKAELWAVVTAALDTLRAAYDLVIIEGAGSAAELNLRQGDMVNMAVAHYAAAPVLLAGDIDRGGIFAQLLGTLLLLEEPERRLVRGLVVNKFRGDASLFQTGVTILEERSSVPVLGVVPFIRDLRIADEDSVALDEKPPAPGVPDSLTIAVIRLPHISNFDDFDPLRAEPGITVRFVEQPADLYPADLLILPGTKTTVADLRWLHERGLAAELVARVRAGTPVLGICGGYQMLGSHIFDPHGSESDTPEIAGLGLLPTVTHFSHEKQTIRVEGRVVAERGIFAGVCGQECSGYEIHMGRTVLKDGSLPLLSIRQRGPHLASDTDGAVDEPGRVAGTYLHGLFENDALRHALLRNLAARKGTGATPALALAHFDRESQYDRLARVVREHLDLERLYRIVAEGVAGGGAEREAEERKP